VPADSGSGASRYLGLERIMSTANLLVAIQSRLTANCHVSIEHNSLYDDWKAVIATENNNWPHWTSFHCATPNQALEQINGYLDGKVKDHAKGQTVRYKDFLAPK